MNRKDLYIGPLHIIIRRHKEGCQYGSIFWGGGTVLDVWIKKTLFTFRLIDK